MITPCAPARPNGQAILEMGNDGNLKLNSHQNDWSILKLGCAGIAVRMEVDTNHFKGNFPEVRSLPCPPPPPPPLCVIATCTVARFGRLCCFVASGNRGKSAGCICMCVCTCA